MVKNPERRPPRRRERSNTAMLALLAAVVVVMAVVAFTLNRNSPLVATPASSTTEGDGTNGQAGVAPAQGRSGIER